MCKSEKTEKGQQIQESHSIESLEQLMPLVEGLHKTGRIKAIGFDVFGTVLTSLYTRSGLTEYLSKKIADFLQDRMGIIDHVECLKHYQEARDEIKTVRRRANLNISAKEIECSESEVLTAVGDFYEVGDIKGFVAHIQNVWLEYDLQNTQPIAGMPDIINRSVKIFGQGRVGLYTNNSCNISHVVTLLERNGYFDSDMLDPSKVFVSSETGIRKPNALMFKEFSENLTEVLERLRLWGMVEMMFCLQRIREGLV